MDILNLPTGHREKHSGGAGTGRAGTGRTGKVQHVCIRRYRHLGQCFHPENSQGSGHQGSGTGSQDLFRGSGRGYIQKYVQAGSPDTQEDIEFMGPVRLVEAENAQQRIVGIIRALDEANEIIIARGGDHVIVE